jgi:parallel beta-helix repeat protein
MVSDPVDQELEHGERLRGCFDYDWECTSPEDIVVVVADHEEGVAEDNETNNHREEIWRCDVIPPQIIQGPIVQEETRESAVIVWETDEDSDSIVRYGKTARLYDLEEGDSAMVIEHSITLSRLEASTTYNFVVQSTDASGNTVVSDELTFETAPLPDGEDPTVVIVDPGVCQGIVAISAEAEDNIGVEKVEFYLGDKLVFTDYSPPYELSLDTAKYENGEYALETRAYDIAGRYVIDERIIRLFNVIDVTIPSVNIITPSQGDTVSGTITVKALVSDDEALSHGYFWVGPDPKMHYASWWTGYPSPKEATIEMNWNTKGSKNGPLRIAWEIYDKKGNVGWGYRDVKVDNVLPPAPPKLTITNRNIKRNNNYFTISLTVKNVGGQTATSITIWDYLQLFQPIDDSDSIADYQSEFNHKLMRWKVEINSKVDIPKGGERTYTYDVVPVMTPKSAGPYISCPKPMIGAYATCGVGWWKWEGETHLQYQQPGGIGYFHEWKNQGKLVKDIFVATHEADYLIVTNPSQLFSHNQGNEDDVNALLSEMAQLAKHRNGVLGYLDFTDRNKFRNLIKPGMPWTKANWAYRLHPDFSKPVKGYLLIVGEVEIVPAWLRAEWNLKWSNWKCITREVDITDLPYADTGGNNGAPELIVGRIIGNTAADLATAIQTSNRVYEKYPGYSFNRSDALLVSGIDSNSNIQKSFTNFVDDTEKIINKEFTVHKLHWSGVGVVASQRVPQFRNNASNNDVICYQGHGGPDAWVPLNTIDFPGKPFATPPLPPINFGSTNPLVLGLACLTGSYEDHTANAPCGDFDGGDDNIAEAFFDHGAAVYIGSTEVSPISHNCEAGKVFFKKWWKPYTTIGKALTDLKRDRWSHGTVWQFWVTEYNLYGDPKFGAAHPGTVATAPFQKTSLEPVASLDVVVPDYEVTTRDGVDYVEIPGGDVLLEEGEYRIPYYSVSIEYPTGYKVQDVVLTDMSGMVTDTGLNIPTITNLIAFLGDKSSPVSGVDDGWVPAQGNYRWEILENPDGTSILVIIMYPFYYNPLTTDVRFYKNYSFDINYTVSPVAITTLTTDRNEYQQGDTVMVDIELNNSGDAQNAIVSASVKRYGSGDTVDGLLLRTLKDFEGIASFSSRWDSSGFDPGYYYMEVALKDTNGNVLDRQTEMFRLGISSGEITNFTATPEYFGIGDEIEINMTFNNTGTVNITGRAVIKIGNSTGGIVKEFRHNVTDLTLSESISFIDTWNTSGAEEGSYNIIGYVLYDSKATIPVTATICSCVIPTDDLYINSDTTLCPGFYNIPDSGADGVIIINASNIVLGCNGATLNGDGSGFGIYNPGFDNVTIKNGNVLNYEIGIHLSGSDSSIISNNTVSQSSTQGISIESSHYCNVYDNCVSFSGDRGIVFGGGGNNAVYNNIVYNNSAYGAIEAISSDNNEIYNNTAYFNQWGIATNHGSNNLICDNTIYGNELGVYLDWPSTNNRVFNNDISSNNEGIWTNHNSTDNIIAGNIIFSNEYAGIHIETDNNTVTNNTANNNRIGLYLCADSTGNTVNYNTFCNNSWYDVRDEDSNSGDENICDLTDNWNDAGTTGCTYTCIGKPDLKISDLKGPDWSKYVGKEVTVEGIFVRDPLPMLVTDLDIVRVNMPMPDDQYILLIGNEAEEIDPRRYGGAKLRLKGLVTEIDDSSKYGDEYVAIESISYEMLERLEEYAPEIVHIEAYPEQ